MTMENRDRGKRVELRSGTKQDALAALEHFLETEHSGRIGFEKEGESFSLWATSEIEPTTALNHRGS
jgi:hypothetical protein